jgi:hypothetical protein
MDANKASVSVEIHWYQVLNAAEKIAKTRDIDRLSTDDVEKLTKIARTVLDRLKEAGRVPEKLVDITCDIDNIVNEPRGWRPVQDIVGAIERGEATLMGRRLQFDKTHPVPPYVPNFTAWPLKCLTCGVEYDWNNQHFCTKNPFYAQFS